jgi:hypothetical protein
MTTRLQEKAVPIGGSVSTFSCLVGGPFEETFLVVCHRLVGGGVKDICHD